MFPSVLVTICCMTEKLTGLQRNLLQQFLVLLPWYLASPGVTPEK